MLVSTVVSLFFSFSNLSSSSGSPATGVLMEISKTDMILEELLAFTDCDSSLTMAIKNGMKGYNHFAKHQDLNKRLIVVDFTQPSFEKRFYVFDLEKRALLYHNYVAHGKNSGVVYARKFSNERHSNSSSLGFYRTAETYFGKHGLSLRLDGLEEGVNDKARERAVVIHSAKYANSDFIKKYGRLGRSFGCPSLPERDYAQVIDLIKEGSLLFIYYPDPHYLGKSKI